MSLQLNVINRIHDVAILELPPGTIIAWIPGADEQLPNRWQICDGSVITEGEWKDKNTPDLTHAFLVGGAKVAVDVGSGGPREFNPPVEPGAEFIEISTDQKSFCSSYELRNPGSASLSCRENSEIYEVVYIMRVR